MSLAKTGVCQPARLESKAVPHFRNLARHSRSFLVAGPDQAVSLRIAGPRPNKALCAEASLACDFISFKPAGDRAEQCFTRWGERLH
jgi:hypothetical protein